MADNLKPWLSLLLALSGIWMLLGGWRALATTTLQAAWWWTAIALGAVGMTEVVLEISARSDADLFRYAIALLIFTPTMALLGAKRPQNAAWQFVVLTMWGVLALPAGEIWLRGRGDPLAIDPVRSWLLLVLIAVGAVNHLPTRFALAAIQFSAAQTLLLWPHLPLSGPGTWRPPAWMPLALVLTALLTVRYAGRYRPGSDAVASVAELRGWSLLWQEFRDWYGAVWSLRVMERVNASAAMFEWPVELKWDGFVWHEPGAPARNGSANSGSIVENRGSNDVQAATIADAERAAVLQALRSLLRRFVSPQWIETRLSRDSSETAEAVLRSE